MVSIWRRAAEVILFIVAVTMLVDFVVEMDMLQNVATDLNRWATIIAAFALGLGAYSLLTRHIRIISRKSEGWPYSIAMIGTMTVFLLTGFITRSITSDQYNWIYSTIIQPISSTMYGMNAFFIASASYRAFRARNWEAALLLVAAIFIMLKNAPIGGVISPTLPAIGKVFWDLAGATGMRGILIGIGIGTLALSLRIILAQEKTPLGGAEE